MTDTKEALLGVLGPPDAFTSKVAVLDAAEVPVESFVYAELGRSYEMVDGLVVGEEEVEAFPRRDVAPPAPGLLRHAHRRDRDRGP